jgi:hypothetical protein
MKATLLFLLMLSAGFLTACATSTNGHVSDAGREVRNDNGFTTLQQSIRL